MNLLMAVVIDPIATTTMNLIMAVVTDPVVVIAMEEEDTTEGEEHNGHGWQGVNTRLDGLRGWAAKAECLLWICVCDVRS